jgi:hypothetical protein
MKKISLEYYFLCCIFAALFFGLSNVYCAERPERLQALGKIAPFFKPPAQYTNDLGKFRSPLLFYDGRTVSSPAQWQERRDEIIKSWHGLMGAWPPVIENPKLEVVESKTRENFTQKKVSIEVVPGKSQEGYLLVPPGKGPFPCVLIVSDLSPLIGIGLGDDPLYKLYDFGLQIVRRGFVTLVIGGPRHSVPGIQPLSSMAYVAANCCNALANLPEVDPQRIGIFGHSYGAKWALLASCLYDKFACSAWSDGGIVFDEKRGNVNYWERWYLGADPATNRTPGMVTAENPRTGAYKRLIEAGHDLNELHALMAPRPFLVSGGAEDQTWRWPALNHAIAVNRFLGFDNRVAMTNRDKHPPTEESNEQLCLFLEYFLKY